MFKFKRNELLASTIIKNLEKRNFNAFYAPDKDEALKMALSLINKDETVSWGGSVSLDEIKIKEYLEKNNYKVINRDKAKNPQEKRELILKGLQADVFLMSANAISYDGEIVNIDGHSNRIAALCYGPKKVIMIIGMNKVSKNLDSALLRARNTAAPINAQRISTIYKMNTPCLKTGACADCKCEDSICSNILITRLCFPKGRINVILVNEELGY